MTRQEAIYNASLIGIGYLNSCEDQAKRNVLRLFKKSNNINYASFDNDKIDHLNKQYEEDQKRYNYLLNKMFDQVLSDNEFIEFNILSDLIGDYTNTYYITKIIDHSIILIDLFYAIKKDLKIKIIKTIIEAILSHFNSFNSKCIKIKPNQAYFSHYVNLWGIFDLTKSNNLDPPDPLFGFFWAFFRLKFFQKVIVGAKG